MRCMIILFLSTLLISSSHSANILAVFPLHVKSHFVMFERLLKRLVEKGHSVDVVTHFPSENAPSRYTQLSLKGSLPPLTNSLPLNAIDAVTESHYSIVQFMIEFGGIDVCEAILKTEILKQLKRSQKRYDLLITEIFGTDCMLGFSHLFNVPIVSITSSVSLPWANDRIGNPDNPSYIPNYYASSTAKMNLYERVENTLLLIASKFLYWFLSERKSNEISKNFFGKNLPDLEELARNTSLLLVNSHFSISHARPAVPNFIEVGGLHIQEPKPLSNHFTTILTTKSKGVIYLTMGSMVQTETFDYDKLQGMFDAFAELPYEVLWKANRSGFPQDLNIPRNIHFEEWMPQTDILCDPNVKLFVSHGGLLGLQEGVYCGVPQLNIPLFADQVHNVFTLAKKGVAIKVAYNDINKQTILDAAQKLLTDPSYKKNAERVSRQFKDRPMPPLDTAVYWVEYVIRHNGAPHLRSAGADLAWYQYYLVDVAFVIICPCIIVVYLAILIVKFIISFLCGARKSKVD